MNVVKSETPLFCNMEHLSKLLEILDNNSSNIPEGDYLLACNSLKSIHKVLHTPYRYPVVNREDLMREYRQLMDRRENAFVCIKRNITARIRLAAVRRLGDYTNFEDLRAAGIAPDNERQFYCDYLRCYNRRYVEIISGIDIRLYHVQALLQEF